MVQFSSEQVATQTEDETTEKLRQTGAEDLCCCFRAAYVYQIAADLNRRRD